MKGARRDEPPSLRAARIVLAKAESAYREPEALEHVEEGLRLLEDVCATEPAAAARIAENLAASYALSITTLIGELLDAEPGLSEPALEHCFKMLLAFDHISDKLPASVRRMKIEIVRRLIDRYYEGHPAADKQRALEQLTGITGD